MKKTFTTIAAVCGFALLSATSALAGPFIIAGTDADDHGSFSAGANQDGWLFMQKALQNIAPGVTNGNQTVVILGSTGSTAQAAATSAFNQSGLAGLGWTLVVVDGTTNLTNFFNNSAAFGIEDAGILMMDSALNVAGGTTSAELAVFTANSTVINNFLGDGGGLFSQSNGYAWATALLPTLSAPTLQAQGLFLTPAGNAAFPGLINQDLSTGPYHNIFSNTGGLPVLATNAAGQAVILGASGGSVTAPSVPDGGMTLAMLTSALGALTVLKRRMGI